MVIRPRPVLSLGLFALLVVCAATLRAETLYNFQSLGSPASGLISGGDGYYYGTTWRGGVDGRGSIYRIDLTTGEMTTLVSFDGPNGSNPYAELLLSGSSLYGTTVYGGDKTEGTLFKIDRSTGALTTIRSLGHDPDGYWPYAGLVALGPFLYGTTYDEGYFGTIYRVDPSNDSFSTLASFGSDYSGPFATPIAVGGLLYGTADQPSGGAVYKFDPSTAVITSVAVSGPQHVLNYPWGRLVATGSLLYGTSMYGGLGYGSVYKVDPATGALSTLASLEVANGTIPRAGLLFDGQSLFGCAERGGPNSWGSIFKVDPATGAVSVVAGFDFDNGAMPSAALTAVGPHFYGTTWTGGPNGGGTVFRLDPADGTLTTLRRFNDLSTGAAPRGGLLAHDGAIYGTTTIGGAIGTGSVYRIDLATLELTTIASFAYSAKGSTPVGGVVAGPDGMLYGTTSEEGVKSNGTLFRINPATGDFATVVAFDGMNGSEPRSDLVVSGDYVYGTTYDSSPGYGTLFRVNTSTGVLETLAQFTGSNGAYPDGSLFLDGTLLYGTTSGGTINNGSVFVFDLSRNVLTTLASFKSGDGKWPHGVVKIGSLLYGTTSLTGIVDGGSVYSVNPATGALTTLASFHGANGDVPRGAVATDGTFVYGTTSGGGANGRGTVFRFDPATGSLATLLAFDMSNGDGPSGNLLVHDGFIYGTTEYGGSRGGGSVFRIPVPDFGPPAGVVAQGSGSGKISVAWQRRDAAATYEIAYSTDGTSYVTAGTTAAETFEISSEITPDHIYLVKVRMIDSTGIASAYSLPDVASTFTFTDDPIEPGVTPVKAVHWTELRTMVDALRVIAGLGPAMWNADIASGRPIGGDGVIELRSALDEARAALTLPQIVYTDNPLTAGTVIRAAHLTNLRGALE